MKKHAGFTLIELIMVVAIFRRLVGTAVPFYHVFRQRTYGSEATVMMSQLLQSEIIYFLANEEFFPKAGDPEICVWNNGADPSAADKQRALEALKVAVPIGHRFDFRIFRDPFDPIGSPCTVEITSVPGVRLFHNASGIRGTVDKTGKTEVTVMP